MAIRQSHAMALEAMAAAAILVAAVHHGWQAGLFQPRKPPIAEMHLTMQDGARLAVTRDEITNQWWNHCADEGVCERQKNRARRPEAAGLPVTGVNYLDVTRFIAWINARSGLHYRLPAVEEWREAASGLEKPQYEKRFTDPRLAWAADYGIGRIYAKTTRPSGSWGTAPNGIRDLEGNVWEWTATCSIPGTPASECPSFIAAGDHEADVTIFVRDPSTGGCATGLPPKNLGFRLVRDLNVGWFGL